MSRQLSGGTRQILGGRRSQLHTVNNPSDMATPRMSGRSADLSGNDEIIKKARSFIELLGKPTLSATAKADLIVLLEEVIESRQQRVTTTSNRPETAMEVGQTNVSAERFDAIEQKLEELKTIAATNTAKVDELKTIITTTSEEHTRKSLRPALQLPAQKLN